MNGNTIAFHPETQKLELQTKQIVPCENTAEEVLLEWSHNGISTIDSKVRTTYKTNSIVLLFFFAVSVSLGASSPFPSAPTISLPQMNGKYSFPIQSFANVNCVTCQGPYQCASEQSINFNSLFVNKHVCLFKTIETVSKTNKIQRKRLDRKRGEERQPFILFHLQMASQQHPTTIIAYNNNKK